MIREVAAAHGLGFAIFRYFNAAGADPDGEIGEDHDPEPHLLPNALAAALGSGPALPIYGTDYDAPDGTCIRDFIHVADLADAHLRGLERLVAGGGPYIHDLATGHGLSVRAVIGAVERALGRPVPTRAAPRRPGDPPALYASGARARAELGWTPARSDIDTIVADAWRWNRARARAREAAP